MPESSNTSMDGEILHTVVVFFISHIIYVCTHTLIFINVVSNYNVYTPTYMVQYWCGFSSSINLLAHQKALLATHSLHRA